jgi:hypothetical protein
MSLEFTTRYITFQEVNIYGAVIELTNAILALFWEGEDPKLGSLSLTLPNKTSSQLLGERSQVLGRVIGEILSTRFDKMSIVSINLSRGKEMEVGSQLINLTREIIKNMEGEG